MKDQPISRAAADRLLIRMIENTYMPPVITLCPGADTPGRLAALTDFAFNCGVGALKASTLRRKVNAGDWDAVPAELMKWVNGGGRRLPGLVRRREAEVAIL
jgi:lysozyme